MAMEEYDMLSIIWLGPELELCIPESAIPAGGAAGGAGSATVMSEMSARMVRLLQSIQQYRFIIKARRYDSKMTGPSATYFFSSRPGDDKHIARTHQCTPNGPAMGPGRDQYLGLPPNWQPFQPRLERPRRQPTGNEGCERGGP